MKIERCIKLSLLTITICSYNSFVKDNDLKINNLYGKVKSVNEIRYKAIDSFGTITKGERQSSQNKARHFIFNQNGYIIEGNRYDEKGKLYLTTIYNYDSNGNKTVETSTYSNGSWNSKVGYKYDNDGNLIEESRFTSEGSVYEKLINQFDKSGHILEKSKFTSGGEFVYKKTYKYDNNHYLFEENEFSKNSDDNNSILYKNDNLGNKVEEKSYNKDKNLDSRTVYKYDSQNKLIEKEEFEFHKDITYTLKTLYKYDNFGNILEEIRVNSQSMEDWKESFKYFYDSNNNWIKLIYYFNSFPKLVVERSIEYY